MARKAAKRRKTSRYTGHPEIRKGEIFLTNADDEVVPITLGEHTVWKSGWECIGWKTKRRGQVALDIKGRPIPDSGFFPVFVQRSELAKKGITPESLARADREASRLLRSL